jgi:diguanylate cyclase (GGDEF)-like protein
VLMIDLDHFKLVNDTYGHAAGDRVLIAAASGLRAAMRDEDVVARWGGEEFVVAGVVPDDEALRRIGQRLLHAIGAIEEPGLPRLAASIGAARSDARSVDDLVAAADAALYAAKRRGRARVVLERDLSPADAEQTEPDDLRLARALARAACARTGRPLSVVERVAETAALIARRMGLDAATTRECVLGLAGRCRRAHPAQRSSDPLASAGVRRRGSARGHPAARADGRDHPSPGRALRWHGRSRRRGR